MGTTDDPKRKPDASVRCRAVGVSVKRTCGSSAAPGCDLCPTPRNLPARLKQGHSDTAHQQAAGASQFIPSRFASQGGPRKRAYDERKRAEHEIPAPPDACLYARFHIMLMKGRLMVSPTRITGDMISSSSFVRTPTVMPPVPSRTPTICRAPSVIGTITC